MSHHKGLARKKPRKFFLDELDFQPLEEEIGAEISPATTMEYAEHRALLKEAISSQEKIFKSSLSWKIGRIFVSPLAGISMVVGGIGSKLSSTARNLSYEAKILKRRVSGRVTAADNSSIGLIADEFTSYMMAQMYEVTQLEPSNFQRLMIKNKFKFIFIESAWRGYKETWKAKVGTYKKNNYKELKELIDLAKRLDIHVIFWNKEDPVHYDHFKNAAKIVGNVLTSDSNQIKIYQDELGIESPKVLTFGILPSMNNPLSKNNRINKVCFAGTYWNSKYPQRRYFTDKLLDCSVPFGLDIYDRNYHRTANSAEYQFPYRFQNNILGSIPYEEMLDYYKKYKVFINVNSIFDSPTMLARRVFELLASGTPIISSPSKAMESYFSDIIFTSDDNRKIEAEIKKLLSDEFYWAQKSLAGIREVYKNHDFRIKIKNAGLAVDLGSLEKKRILVIAKSESVKLEDEKAFLVNQTLQPTQVVFRRNSIYEIEGVEMSKTDPKFIEYCRKFDYVLLADIRDYYGKYFLEDCLNGFQYDSKVKAVGKSQFFDGEMSDFVNFGRVYDRVQSMVPSATLVSTVVLEEYDIMELEEQITRGLNDSISIDKYNFGKNIRGMKDVQKIEI